jgi:hypothetical protein
MGGDLVSLSRMRHNQYVEDIVSDKRTAFGLSSYPTDFAATRDMTLNGGSYYSYKSQHSVLPLEIPGKRYSPRFRGVVIGTVVGQELTVGSM